MRWRGLTWPLLPLLLAGCGHKNAADMQADKKDAPLPTVQVTTVTTGTLDRTLPATGTLMALRDHEATLSPPVAGTLDALPVRYGQAVQQGQVIAHLSTRQLQGQIEQARATVGQNLVQVQQAQANAIQQRAQTQTAIQQALASLSSARATLRGTEATLTGNQSALRNAEQTLARQKTLFSEGLVAQKDVEAADLAVGTAQAQVDAQKQTVAAQAQTVAGQRQAVAAARAASLQDLVKRKDVQVALQQVRNAQGALATARAQEALYTIRAPLSGQVTQVTGTVGETADTTAKLVTIADLHILQLQMDVPTSAARQVRPGETVTFSVSSLPGERFRTVVSTVASQVDAATGTVPILATVANPRRLLRDDTTVKAQIVTERRINVLLVPQAAVLTDPDTGKTSVVTVGSDAVAHITPVKLGLSAAGRVEITSGVTAGQKVAVTGQYGLPDATKVSVQNAPAASPVPFPEAQDVFGSGRPSPAPSSSSSSNTTGGKTNGP